MRLAKYHGLGNDYLVLDEAEAGHALAPEWIRLICHRNHGVGADGILLGPIRTAEGGMRVRIFNPIAISKDCDVTQTGPAVKICEGEISPEMFTA